MNRKERRAKGVKNTDRTIVLKESEVRAFIRNFLKNDPDVQKEIAEESRRVSIEELNKQEVDVDTIILSVLHNSEGYGRKRLLRFAGNFIALRNYYKNRYEDCDMFAMRKHLKESTGIDVENLSEELRRFATEENTNKG